MMQAPSLPPPLFSSTIPYELDQAILNYLDIASLAQAQAVSKSWQQRTKQLLKEKLVYRVAMTNLEELVEAHILTCETHDRRSSHRYFHIKVVLEQTTGKLVGYHTSTYIKDKPFGSDLRVKKYQIIALHDNLRMEKLDEDAYTLEQPKASSFIDQATNILLSTLAKGVEWAFQQFMPKMTTYVESPLDASLPETCQADRVINHMLLTLNKASELALQQFIKANGAKRFYSSDELSSIYAASYHWQGYMTFTLCQEAESMSQAEYESLVQQRQALTLLMPPSDLTPTPIISHVRPYPLYVHPDSWYVEVKK